MEQCFGFWCDKGTPAHSTSVTVYRPLYLFSLKILHQRVGHETGCHRPQIYIFGRVSRPHSSMHLTRSKSQILTSDKVEMGSKNHEVVPTSLIVQISGLRHGGVNKLIGSLAKRNLVSRLDNSKCATDSFFFWRLGFLLILTSVSQMTGTVWLMAGMII